jgi:hypothetical protein
MLNNIISDVQLLFDVTPANVSEKQWNLTRLLQVFIIASLGASLLDHIHIQTHTTEYSNPVFFGQAWYMFLVFGIGITLGYIQATPFAKKVYPVPPSLAQALTHVTILIVNWYISGYFHYRRDLVATFLWITFVTRAASFKFNRTFMIFSLILAIASTTFEASLSATGAFKYHGHDIFGVPLWLPALYCHAAPAGLALARMFPVYK